ncbi:type VI secretion system lipoprotein TssJ [Enterobacter hormaechei]|nr:type VI secretion system lipoprotein TssJ [Enterobacter hormaechei]
MIVNALLPRSLILMPCYRTEFTSADHAISKEMMLMKAASLTLQAPVDQGYGIKIQQPVRVIQGVVTGFERLGTSKDETRYAVTLEPRLALLSRSHQNAVYQDMSVPQIVEKILRERHGMRGQDFLFSLSKEYPRREQVMQYAEDDLHFITRLLGEVGIWFRFTTDTRLNIDVVEFYDSRQGYEKGLTLPSVPPSGQHSQGVDSVWDMECHHNVVQKAVSTRDYNYRQASEDMNTRVDATRGDTTTYGEAYHWADNYLTPGSAYDRNPAPESGAFYARIRHERYLNGQTQTVAFTSCPALSPGMLLIVTGGYEVAEVFAQGVVVTAMHSHAQRDADFCVRFDGIPDSPDYQQLLNDGETILKTDLMATRDVVVKPGGDTNLDMPMEEETQFVAVVGLFRHPDLVNNTWKQVLKREDLDPDKPRILEAGNNHLTLQPLKDD